MELKYSVPSNPIMQCVEDATELKFTTSSGLIIHIVEDMLGNPVLRVTGTPHSTIATNAHSNNCFTISDLSRS